MKCLLFVLLITFLSPLALATESCEIKVVKIPYTQGLQQIPFGVLDALLSPIEFTLQVPTWEACWQVAVNYATLEPITGPFWETELMNLEERRGTAHSVSLGLFWVTFFKAVSWEFNDGWLDDSGGIVTRYCHSFGPQLGRCFVGAQGQDLTMSKIPLKKVTSTQEMKEDLEAIRPH